MDSFLESYGNDFIYGIDPDEVPIPVGDIPSIMEEPSLALLFRKDSVNPKQATDISEACFFPVTYAEFNPKEIKFGFNGNHGVVPVVGPTNGDYKFSLLVYLKFDHCFVRDLNECLEEYPILEIPTPI